MWPAMHHEKTVWRCDARPALIANSFLYPSLTQQTLNIIEILVHNKASALTWKHFTRTARLGSLHTENKKTKGTSYVFPGVVRLINDLAATCFGPGALGRA
jgi:hypothetical protein